jgi:type II secretory pathway pseudopilin PulG
MEMLVVMAIIGLIVAVSGPAVSAGIDSVRMASATDEIAAFLNAAVNYCERRQQAVEVEIDARGNRLAAYSEEGGFAREWRLPDGIVFEGEGEDLRRLILLPGGTVPGIAIAIVNRRGGRRIVRLDPMTGFPDVECVEVR